MSQATNEQNYWKAYCQIIKSSIAPTLGPNAALFFCTEAVRCVPAADFIPIEVTNLGTFFIADSMLDPTNMFYVPSTSDGYLKSLQTYLSWVDIGGSNDEGVISRFIDAQTNLANAQAGVTKALTAALADYGQATTAGLTTDKFPTWAASNAAQYNNAVRNYQGCASQAKKAAADKNGALAPQFNRDQDLIDSALYSAVPVTGVTMDCTNIDSNQLRQQLGQALSGNPPSLTPATGVYEKGAYSLQSYASTLKTWSSNFPAYKKNPQSKSVSLSSGASASLSDFGHTDISGSASFTWAPFISFGASFSSSETRESMSVENSSYNITITLTYGDMKSFPILPGKWDIGNPKKTYPTLRSDAPPQVSNLVQPTALLCASAVGLNISFGGGAEKSFDSLYQKYQSGSGGVRILGFDIGLGGSASSSQSVATHSGSWDANSGVFNVQPVDGAGWCTLLGVLGQKFT